MTANSLKDLKSNLNKARWDDYSVNVLSGSKNPKLTLTILTSLLLLWNNCLCLAWFQNATNGKEILDFLLKFNFVYVQHHYRNGHGVFVEQHYVCTLTRLGVEYIQYCHLDSAFNTLLNKPDDYVPAVKVPSKTKEPKTYVHFSDGGATAFVVIGDLIICTLFFLLLVALHLTVLGGLMFLVSLLVIHTLSRVVHFLDPYMDQMSQYNNGLMELSMDQSDVLSDSIKRDLKQVYRNDQYQDTESDLIQFVYLYHDLPDISHVDSLIRTMTYFIFVPMNDTAVDLWFPLFPL